MKKYICQSCGGDLSLRENGLWECPYCHSLWQDETVQRDAEEILKIVGDYNEAQKAELVSNIRRQLYDAINEKYTDSEKITSLCRRLKEYLPDDFMANFYEIANGKDLKRTADIINNINVDAYGEYVEGVLKFMIKSFADVFHLPLVNLVERAYSKTDKEKFEQYHTLIQEEAQKENDGVYQTALSRDVFVAYSSKDMPKVIELVSYLEASGLKCFVAARNLRHGAGAVQNYKNAIAEAIQNCKSVVFVSSQSSRNFSCDAVRFELPLIKQTDVDNAPAEYKQNYSAMPYIYKKPRVEYRLEDSLFPNAADDLVKEFFDGLEYAYNVREVGSRIIKALNEAASRSIEKKHETVREVIKVKETVGTSGVGTESLLKRVFMFLEDGDFKSADEYCEKVLDIDPECAMAYLGKLMVELRVKRKEDLANCAEPFDSNKNYQKAVRFAQSNFAEELRGYISYINERNNLKRLTILYNNAVLAMNSARSSTGYKVAGAQFKEIFDFKDSASLAQLCFAKYNELAEKEKVEAQQKAEEKRIADEKARLEKLRRDEQKKIESEKRAKKIKKVVKGTLISVGIITALFVALIIGVIIYLNATDKPIDNDFNQKESQQIHGLAYYVPANWVYDVEGSSEDTKYYVRYNNWDEVIALMCLDYIGETNIITVDEAVEDYTEDYMDALVTDQMIGGQNFAVVSYVRESDNYCSLVYITEKDSSVFQVYFRFTNDNSGKEIFEEIVSAVEFDKYVNPMEATYSQAIAYMAEGKYTEAVSVFSSIENYKDSKNKIDECLAQLGTGILNSMQGMWHGVHQGHENLCGFIKIEGTTVYWKYHSNNFYREDNTYLCEFHSDSLEAYNPGDNCTKRSWKIVDDMLVYSYSYSDGRTYEDIYYRTNTEIDDH